MLFQVLFVTFVFFPPALLHFPDEQILKYGGGCLDTMCVFILLPAGFT